jgi:hypothetical protein
MVLLIPWEMWRDQNTQRSVPIRIINRMVSKYICNCKQIHFKSLVVFIYMQIYQWANTWCVCCFGTQVIGCFVEQVLAVYGLLANLREGFAVNNVAFVSAAVIFSCIIMVICNTAQCATEEVGILLVHVSLYRVGISNACLLQCWMGDDDDYVDDYN